MRALVPLELFAKYFQNHHERALQVMILTHYTPQSFGFNRRLHNRYWTIYWTTGAQQKAVFLLSTMMTC